MSIAQKIIEGIRQVNPDVQYVRQAKTFLKKAAKTVVSIPEKAASALFHEYDDYVRVRLNIRPADFQKRSQRKIPLNMTIDTLYSSPDLKSEAFVLTGKFVIREIADDGRWALISFKNTELVKISIEGWVPLGETFDKVYKSPSFNSQPVKLPLKIRAIGAELKIDKNDELGNWYKIDYSSRLGKGIRWINIPI